MLQRGGSAADAAVAIAAALNVTEPCSTGGSVKLAVEPCARSQVSRSSAPCAGIGGDAFCLFFDAKTKEVTAILGCGAAPAALTLEARRSPRVKSFSFLLQLIQQSSVLQVS